jgi:hypothetical protein
LLQSLTLPARLVIELIMPELHVEHRIARKQAAEQRRVRWATRMAILAVAVHLLAAAVLSLTLNLRNPAFPPDPLAQPNNRD